MCSETVDCSRWFSRARCRVGGGRRNSQGVREGIKLCGLSVAKAGEFVADTLLDLELEGVGAGAVGLADGRSIVVRKATARIAWLHTSGVRWRESRTCWEKVTGASLESSQWLAAVTEYFMS
jgi:hypothetical protein